MTESGVGSGLTRFHHWSLRSAIFADLTADPAKIGLMASGVVLLGLKR